MGDRIEIPFRDDMRHLAMLGLKTATTRRKKYGEPGDWFELTGLSTLYKAAETRRYELVSVEQMLLWKVRDFHFKEEGFASEDDFRKVWLEIHPSAGFQANWKVWFHVFKEVEIEQPDDAEHDHHYDGPSEEELRREAEEQERLDAGMDGGRYL
jgi:hypothetical protein